MNTIAALGFDEKGDDLIVTYLSPFYGKKTEKGYVWYLPAIDSWFQTKLEDEEGADRVAEIMLSHFTQVFLVEESISFFIYKLLKIGYTGLDGVSPEKLDIKGLVKLTPVLYEDRVGPISTLNIKRHLILKVSLAELKESYKNIKYEEI